MIRIMVKYRIKPEMLQGVRTEINAFMKAIREHEPETVYEVYETDEEFTFVHLIIFTDRNAQELHRTSTYTDRFTNYIYARCEEEPVYMDLQLFDSAQ